MSDFILGLESLAATAIDEAEAAALGEILAVGDVIMPLGVAAAETVGADVIVAATGGIALPIIAVGSLLYINAKHESDHDSVNPKRKRRKREPPTPEIPDISEPSDPVKPSFAGSGDSKKSKDINMVQVKTVATGFKTTSKTHIEYGSTVSDAHSVYVGIGPRLSDITRALSEAVAGCLFDRAGIDAGMGEAIEGSFFWKFQYYTDPTASTISTGSSSALVNATKLAHVTSLANLIQGTKATDNPAKFIQFALWFSNVVTVSHPVLLARIDPQGLSVSISQANTMMLQNQTTGLAGASETTSVTNNPLYALLYECKGNIWLTKLISRLGTQTRMNTYEHAVCFFPATKQWLPADLSTTGKFQNAKITNRFTLGAGAICKLQGGFIETHKFNTWAQMVPEGLNAENPNDQINFGRSKMLCFERSVHSIAGESPIVVAFENDYVQTVGYKYNPHSAYIMTYTEEMLPIKT